MTRKKWADVQKAFLDKMSPEGRARYEVMEQEFALQEFVGRGQRAQAAADEVILRAESDLAEVQARVSEVGFDVTVQALLAMDGMTKGETELRADLESGLPTCGECDRKVIWSHGRFMHRLDGKTVWPLDDETGHEPSMRDDYVSPWKNGDPQ